jgi:hypothetical protein
MRKIPRASLTISILSDEDYGVLMASRDGPQTFGVFVAMLLVGRDRFQQKRARLMGKSSLVISDSLAHVASLGRISQSQLEQALAILARIAEQTGTQPWMYLDDDSHLVIRSFFKFNTKSGWSGQRFNKRGSVRDMPYQEYLQTDHWQELRQKALDRDGHCCRLCRSLDELQVHHNTYERRGMEELDDLITLCKRCHRKFHNKGVES